MISNNGLHKNKTDASETISKEEVDYLVEASRKLYRLYEEQFLDWIKINPVPEYDKPCGIKHKTYGGWWIKKTGGC